MHDPIHDNEITGNDATRGGGIYLIESSGTLTDNTITGNTIAADYVYHMEFDGDRIKHMTKIWNDTISLQQLGWA